MGILNALPLFVLVPTFHVIACYLISVLLPLAHSEIVPQTLALLRLEHVEHFPLACVAIAFAFTLLSYYPYAIWVSATAKAYNNNNPRLQRSSATGLGDRLSSAHQNMHESFPSFAVAVLTCYLLNPSATVHLNALCAVYLHARVLYQCMYTLNVGALRSLSFIISWDATALIFVLALWPKCVLPYLPIA